MDNRLRYRGFFRYKWILTIFLYYLSRYQEDTVIFFSHYFLNFIFFFFFLRVIFHISFGKQLDNTDQMP